LFWPVALGAGVRFPTPNGNTELFVKVLDLEVPWAHSYADMQPSKTDRERRENYRRAAAGRMESIPADPRWWAFRIGVQKSGRALDVDNVAKTIIYASTPPIYCAKSRAAQTRTL
jgi:hypothetical protein